MNYVDIKRNDGEVDRVAVFSVSDFPYYQIPEYTRHAKHKKIKYMTIFATFDIETSTIHPDPNVAPEGFMYHWQMTIGGVVIAGRRWEEWLELMKKVSDWLDLNDEKRMVVYVHNLSYEFQFIRNFLKDDLGGFDIFATARRVPIYVSCGAGFEFRCSYKLTNMRLEKAVKNEQGIQHPKAAGDLDYKIVRTADTPLSPAELGYCISDVICLHELIENRLKNEGDTLDSIPLTSTGYVRRECRRNCRKDRRYREKVFLKQQMTPEVYTMLKEAGRGGNTHANRYMSDRLWYNVDSFDAVSMYPGMMMLRPFPASKFSYYGDVESMAEFRKLLKEKACLFRIILRDVKVKASVTMPYIPSAKVLYHGSGSRYDNGRVLQTEWLCMTVTDIDFKIIENQYEYSELSISDMYIATYAPLPDPIRETVLEYFRTKCELKDQIEKASDPYEIENLTYLYKKVKNRLNGIFGMAYTDPVRQEITIDASGAWQVTAGNVEEKLEQFYKSRNSFLVYAWGVWVTAWARLHLQTLLDITGGDTIYCDTDSSKAIITPKILQRIRKENKKIELECEKTGAYCDVDGKRYYLGTFEHETEKEKYQSFKTLGAKKYAYTDSKGFHITIAGVNKKKGSHEMEDINNFRPGFIFKDAGGKTLYYNDSEKHYLTVDGCRMLTASNIGMIDSTYELGITDEYAELLKLNIYKEV